MNILICILSILIAIITSQETKQNERFVNKKMLNYLEKSFPQLIDPILEEFSPMSKDLQFSTCSACLSTFKLFNVFSTDKIKFVLKAIAKGLCEIANSENVCYGLMQDYFESFVSNFYGRYLTSQHLCTYIHACKDTRIKVDFESWKQKVLSDKSNQTVQNYASLQKVPTYRMLHLADLHLDLEYTEGSLSACDDFFCCRPESGDYPQEESKKAKYWGTLANCDIPLRTIKALLKDAAQKKINEEKVDFIIWTGDSISHDVWHQNYKNQTLPQEQISNFLKDIFPKTPVYPIFGNHENYPGDQYDITGQDTSSWIRTSSANMWKQWLDAESYQQLYNKGYYAQFNKKHNIRFIALNTQTCDNLNFYLFFNNTDPNGQIEFLYQQLIIAEKNYQHVIIFGHIPIGDNTCSSQWALRYQVLVDRFEHVIIGQFFGHTHNDHIESIMSSQGEKRSVGTIYIAPSGTTYPFLNPSYRIFEFKNNQISNYYQYRLDLDKANQNIHQEPTWDLAYDFLSEYTLKDMSNDSLYDLAFNKLVNNEDLLKKYILHFYAGNQSQMPNKIDTKVRRYFLCQAQNVIFDERFKCIGIYGIYYYTLEIVYQFLQSLQGQWLIQN